jgi:Uma2 family endonuclease
MADTTTLITADQFFQMSFPDERVELSEGELIRMPLAGFEHSHIAVTLVGFLDQFARERQLGQVTGADGGYQLNAHTVRAPDVGFVSGEKLAKQPGGRAFYPGAPDLAVEVISPTDSAGDIQKKIREYFRAGTRVVWVVYPELREIHVYRSANEMRVVQESGTLSGNDVLPGFSLRVEELFR